MDGATVMLILSLALNVLVLVPLTASLLGDTSRMLTVYGPRTPARDILLSIYLAILVASVSLLALVSVEATRKEAQWAGAGLLGVQVLYKVLTFELVDGGVPPGMGMRINPVVGSNIAIALVHLVSLATLVFGARL
jgi:hypothetical protein